MSTGTFLMSGLRILFSSTPVSCRRREERKQERNKIEISEPKAGVVNHGIEVSDDEIAEMENNIRSRKDKQRKSQHETTEKDCTSLSPHDFGSGNRKKEEIILDISKLE